MSGQGSSFSSPAGGNASTKSQSWSMQKQGPGAASVPTAPRLCRTPRGSAPPADVYQGVLQAPVSPARVTQHTHTPCAPPGASLETLHPRSVGTVCRNASLASLSCQAEDKFLLSQWLFGRQFIYLGCRSLIVHGNVYPKYLIAGLHKRRLPGEEAQAAAGAGITSLPLVLQKLKILSRFSPRITSSAPQNQGFFNLARGLFITS